MEEKLIYTQNIMSLLQVNEILSVEDDSIKTKCKVNEEFRETNVTFPVKVGDWIYSNGSEYTKVPNRPLIISVWAQSAEGGISMNGKIGWNVPEDLEIFRFVLKHRNDPVKINAVILGAKTYKQIPNRTLRGLEVAVISSTVNVEEGSTDKVYKSVDDAVRVLIAMTHVENVIIAGGKGIYDETLSKGIPDVIYVTKFNSKTGEFETDNVVKQPELFSDIYKVSSVSDTLIPKNKSTTFVVYQYDKEPAAYLQDENQPLCIVANRHPGPWKDHVKGFVHEEYQYLRIIRDIVDNGCVHSDRTGVGTKAVFGRMMRYNLENGRLPLFTTKRTFYKGVLEELLWFIVGDTNANHLAEKGVHIWDGNGSKDFLEKRGLDHREEGDLGPVYGFQWRHFGAEYYDMHADYRGKGVDQLAKVVKDLKEDPYSRRHVVSAWNPADEHLMALPPCHMFYQFYTENGKLSCMMYQRSADMGLGVPFNVASYSLLTHIIGHVTGLEPFEFVHVIGNAHVYLNHIDALEQQMKRHPYAFPTVTIERNREWENIFDFKTEDFHLKNYCCHNKLKMDMAV